jgi:hypothetical protein
MTFLFKNRKENKEKSIDSELKYRFDLGAKYFYVKCFDRNINCSYYKKLYAKHMYSFNNCNEQYSEKKKLEDFFREFESLINDIKLNGFNKKYPIPIGKNLVLINGAHRFITSKYFNIEPTFLHEQRDGTLQYNYDFFINRRKYGDAFVNLEEEYSDFIALNNLQLFKNTKNVRAIIIYPNAHKINKNKEIESILKTNGTIMYKKVIKLSEKGLKNLIIELYRGEEWIGGLFPKNDNNLKFQRCYCDYPLIFYMYYFNDLNDIEVKNKVRNLFDFGKNSIHITDNYQETFRVSSSLLNKNSLFFLKYGTNMLSSNTANLLGKYFDKVKSDENFAVSSSVILELFSLRKANNDLDYVNREDLELGIENIGAHKGKSLNYYYNCKDELLFDPNNYFYINGHKFINLDLIKNMKESRGLKKDIDDVKLISNFIDSIKT